MTSKLIYLKLGLCKATGGISGLKSTNRFFIYNKQKCKILQNHSKFRKHTGKLKYILNYKKLFMLIYYFGNNVQ